MGFLGFADMGFHNMTITLKTHFSFWGMFRLVILLSALLTAANWQPCLATAELTEGVSVPLSSIAGVVCPNPNSFCSPSTLARLSSEKDSSAPRQWSARISDSGFFRLLGGKSVSCSLDNEDFKTKEVDNSHTMGLKLTYLPNIEVRPHLLDWGEKFLYVSSLAFVAVTNTRKDNISVVIEPYSANSQFYFCNSSFEVVVLGPGETCSICFGFLPTSLGLASDHLVLQTNYGDFLVKDKGFAIETPYGRGSKNSTFLIHFSEALCVEVIISRASVSSGNASVLTRKVCSVNNNDDNDAKVGTFSLDEWLNDTFIISLEVESTKKSDFVSLSLTTTIKRCGNGGTAVFALFAHNGSGNSPVEIPCRDIFSICVRNKSESSEGEENVNNSQGWIGADAEEATLMNWRSRATASDLSVLENLEVKFPVIEVGHMSSEWITVQNPSREPVLVQLILTSAEVIDECGPLEMHLQASSSNTLMGSNNSRVLARFGFSIDSNAVTEALVSPLEVASLGPVWFRPGSPCRWKSLAFIRSNLSGAEWVSLSGVGGSVFMVLLQEEDQQEPIQSLDFKMNSLNSSFHGKSIGCSQALTKEVYAKNIGDLPLRVTRIGISGTGCASDGFSVNSCKGFSLSPGESKKIVVSYQTDFSLATVHRDLELSLSNGILVIPMKVTLPMHILSLCKKTFLERLRISLVRMLLVAFTLFLFTTQLRKPQAYEYYYYYTPKSGKTRSSRNTLVAKPPAEQEKGTTARDQQKTSIEVGDSDTREVQQNGKNNLRVKLGNEAGKRRKRKKGSSSGGNKPFDVSSSSHSGNSTPSPGPRSPVLHSKPVPNKEVACNAGASPKVGNGKNALISTTTQEKKPKVDPSPPPSDRGMPVVSYAETLVPPLRAPGSRVRREEAKKVEETKGWSERFVTYDIWGDHLFGLHLTKDNLLPMTAAPVIHNNSDSFFARGPQILMTNNSQQKVVSYDHDGY